ncbi:hypothetical protein [Metabacillus hrfriensis]|uniref:Uncharacterized protein n=1 Tax=Metabacillus hrfriensis TaxID=3048891 RepID=A0ACD4RE68_9BACI|nr:hypothetical protein [Metabacillus sp. CT-WN-B3]WHZ58707.1 hypothetical protein QLQ22_05000 [Metabacillus sp. CT-WN-B3]
MHVLYRNAEPTDQLRQADKNSTEKSGFEFFGEFVLAEELGDGAGKQEMRNRLISSDRQNKDPTEKALFVFTGGAVLTEELGGEAGQQKCGNARLAPTGR